MYRIVCENNSIGRPVFNLYFANTKTNHRGYRYFDGAMRIQKLLIAIS